MTSETVKLHPVQTDTRATAAELLDWTRSYHC
jgi:hypothetical protein